MSCLSSGWATTEVPSRRKAARARIVRLKEGGQLGGTGVRDAMLGGDGPCLYDTWLATSVGIVHGAASVLSRLQRLQVPMEITKPLLTAAENAKTSFCAVQQDKCER
jgi:hypothetical protein